MSESSASSSSSSSSSFSSSSAASPSAAAALSAEMPTAGDASARHTGSFHRQNFMIRSQQLRNKDTAPSMLLNLVKEVRERIEIVHSSEYCNFLQCYFPAFETLLSSNVPPQFQQGPLNQVRFIVLEILNRLPSNELLKPYIVKLLRLTMAILAVDNQENALVCLKIIFNLHKNFRPILKEYVPEFLRFVQSLYTNLEATRVAMFNFPAPPVPVPQNAPTAMSSLTSSSSSSSTSPPAKSHEMDAICMRSTCSFKVVTECPLIVMLLFQLYPEHVREHVKIFIPLMIAALKLAPPNVPANTTSPASMRSRFSEMVACQVKTLSFLTYLLKSFKPQMQPYEEVIAHAVV